MDDLQKEVREWVDSVEAFKVTTEHTCFRHLKSEVDELESEMDWRLNLWMRLLRRLYSSLS